MKARSILGRLRASIRLLYLLHGLGRFAVFGVLLLFALYAGDRLLEYPQGMRITQVFLVAAIALYVLHRVLIRPCFRTPLTDDDLALLVERSHPGLRERFITVVQAERHPEIEATADPRFMQRLREETASLVDDLRASRALSFKWTSLSFLAGAVLIAGAVGGALAQGELTGIFFQRLLGASVPWPRETLLAVTLRTRDGEVLRRELVQGTSEIEIPRSNSLRVEIRALGEVPRNARLMTEGGRIDEVSRQSQDAASNDVHFVFTYREIASDFSFWVEGGDDDDSDPLIHVKTYPSPVIRAIWADIDTPDYLRAPLREEQRIPQGNLVALDGSSADVFLLVDGDVGFAEARFDPAPEPGWKTRELERLDSPPAPPAGLQVDGAGLTAYRLAGLPIHGERSFFYRIHLKDRNGRSAERPNAYLVTPVADEAPSVELRLVGIPAYSISDKGALLAIVEASDEHDLGQVQVRVFEDQYASGEEAPKTVWSRDLLKPERPFDPQDFAARRSPRKRTVYILSMREDLPVIAQNGVPIQPGNSLLVQASASDLRPGGRPSLSPSAAVTVVEQRDFIKHLLDALREMRAEAMELRLVESEFLATLREVRSAIGGELESGEWTRADTSFDHHEEIQRARRITERFSTVVQGVILNRIGVEISETSAVDDGGSAESGLSAGSELRALDAAYRKVLGNRTPGEPRLGADLELDVLGELSSNPRSVSAQTPLITLLEIGARLSRLSTELHPAVGALTGKLAEADSVAAARAPLGELIDAQAQVVTALEGICDELVRWDSFESILWDFKRTLDNLMRFERDLEDKNR